CNLSQRSADRVREGDVRDEPVPEERTDTAPGAIEELVGNDELLRHVLLLQRPDGARGENELRAEQLHPEDVRAVIELSRHLAVADAVPRQKRHAFAPQGADDVRPGRIAERRGDVPFGAVRQLRHVVEAGSTDDPDRDVIHSASTYSRLSFSRM